MTGMAPKTILFLLVLALALTVFCIADDIRVSAAALTGLVVFLWFSEFFPLPVTGLLVPVLAVATGILTTERAFNAFGNQILFLFIGTFLLVRSMQKHGWDERMASRLLAYRWGSRSVNHLLALVAGGCWLLSMWVSNTATCAMMTPLCLGIARSLRDQVTDEHTYKRFLIRLLLTCAFSSSIGGMATPVGSPPNMLAIQFLQEQEIFITFSSWMVAALPISLLLLCSMFWLVAALFPVPQIDLRQVRRLFERRVSDLGPVTRPEILTAAAFGLAVCLWIIPDIAGQILPGTLSATLQQRLPMGGVAVLAASLLFVLSFRNAAGQRETCLVWRDASEIDWGTIMLFGGGLCLGSVLLDSGLAATIGDWLMSGAGGAALVSLLLILVLTVVFSEIGSNTASAAIVLPVVLGATAGNETATTIQYVLGVAFAASLGFMLPISTPPNAIVFGTGHIPLRVLAKAGVLLDLAGIALIFVFLGLLNWY